MVSLIAIAWMPSGGAQATCAPNEIACAGEATQSPCDGPSARGDGWDGFTGAWGNVSGWEWGVGGWSRCQETEWGAGVFVANDKLPPSSVWEYGRDYFSATARFDYSERVARPCYVGYGVYGVNGAITRNAWIACPDRDMSDLPEEVRDPGWGNVLA